MGKVLVQSIQDSISSKDIKVTFTFTVNGNDYSDYLQPNWTVNTDVSFGSMSAIFTLNNNSEIFSTGGTSAIKVGDVIEFIENFGDDTTNWGRFYGIVDQRAIDKSSSVRTITLNCLDYISVLKYMNIDLVVEGDRVEVVDEVLDPVWLPSPNQDMAQLYNFANDAIATKPIPVIRFKDLNHTSNVDTQYDGFEIYYDTGQLKLGTALNVQNNYSVLATYSYYTRGKYAEDIIEEIITVVDGYGKYLFEESSAADVITNHLTTTYQAQEGSGIADVLSPSSGKSLTIENTLASDVTAGDVTVTLSDATGFPTTGTGTINGDVFSWSGKSTDTLTGVPATGGYSLSAHNEDDYVEYTNTYPAGQVWFLKYSNVSSTLTTSDFTLPSGSTVTYHCKRGTSEGSYIILDSAVGVGNRITCDTNYTFKTLQATGIEINKMIFRSRDVDNRLDAINTVREYLAPNYIIRTQGDSLIWSSYLTQRTIADYDLNLVQSLNYMEDEDLYTRVLMWAKNKIPTNIMFGDDVDYTSDEEDSYTGIATQDTLSYFGEEKSGVLSTWASNQLTEAELLHQTSTQELINYVGDKYIGTEYPTQESTGYYVFGTVISDNRGKIILGDTVPIVYVNGVPIDNSVHQQTAVPVKVKTSTKTITEGGGKSKSVSTTNYYYYNVLFPHTSIVPDQPIYMYDNTGLLQHIIPANDPNMDYANGIWVIPGIERNDVAEVLSTSTYYVLYSTDKLQIDYDDVIFKIHRSILPEPESVAVTATFEYWAIAIAIQDIDHVVDGRRDTQLQLEFFGEPQTNFHLATIDLGATYNVQAIDIVGGFFKPDDMRKFDVGFTMAIQSSTDDVTYTAISDKTENVQITGGDTTSLEEDDLGTEFEARYLKFSLKEVDKINYGRGRYVVALTEISVYNNILIKSEATLIPTTTLTYNATTGDTKVHLTDTTAFSSSGTAYLNKQSTKSFTYTGKTSTTLTGCTVGVGVSGTSGQYVTQSIVGDTTLYDNDGLLASLGDRIIKKIMISDRNLFTQEELDYLVKAYLTEYYKDHNKVQVNIVYAPYIYIGQTVNLTDPYNNVSSQRYFIESISDNAGYYGLVLAYYP